MKYLFVVLTIAIASLCGTSVKAQYLAEASEDQLTVYSNGRVKGLSFRVDNNYKDGSRVTGVSMFVVLWKYDKNGNKIYLGNELGAWIINLRPDYYDTFEFNFEKDYGNVDEIGYDIRQSYVITH